MVVRLCNNCSQPTIISIPRYLTSPIFNFIPSNPYTLFNVVRARKVILGAAWHEVLLIDYANCEFPIGAGIGFMVRKLLTYPTCAYMIRPNLCAIFFQQCWPLSALYGSPCHSVIRSSIQVESTVQVH